MILSDVCAPPCWENIVPGRSTVSDVREAENRLPLIDTERTAWVYKQNQYDTIFSWNFLDSDVKGGWIYFKNGVVELIYLSGGFNVALETVVEKYGFPEFVIVGNSFTPGLFTYGYQNQVHLIYEEAGMIISLKPNVNADIKASTKIDRVMFFDPTEIEAITQEWVSAGLLGELKRWNWQGYGRFTLEGEKRR